MAIGLGRITHGQLEKGKQKRRAQLHLICKALGQVLLYFCVLCSVFFWGAGKYAHRNKSMMYMHFSPEGTFSGKMLSELQIM